VDEIGPPIAYLALREGTPVFDPDGDRIGVVDHVLADEPVDIFHGLIVHTLPLPGRHLFADADQVAELHERGVLLSVDRGQLHEPREPSEAEKSEEGPVENPLQARLRRAWDWISRHV
jgi:uncharacterized protein YrrD